VSGEPLAYRSTKHSLLRYALTGRAVFEADGQSWPVTEGMVAWGVRGQDMLLSAPPGGEYAGYIVLLMGDEADDALQQAFGRPAGAAELTRPDSIEPLFVETIREARLRGEQMVDNCLHLLRVLLRRIRHEAVLDPRENRLARRTYRRCKDHIDRNFTRIRSLAQVARAGGITTPHLCRLFDRFDTMSPYEYLTWHKINMAERLLLASDQSIRAIAKAVGYADWRMFSKNFKARYGQSPARYRKAIRSG
jgi:AraC-like DNA-binding protein